MCICVCVCVGGGGTKSSRTEDSRYADIQVRLGLGKLAEQVRDHAHVAEAVGGATAVELVTVARQLKRVARPVQRATQSMHHRIRDATSVDRDGAERGSADGVTNGVTAAVVAAVVVVIVL